MKKRLLLPLLLLSVLLCLCLSVNAEETLNEKGIYVSTENAYGTVNIIDGYDYYSSLSLNDRVVLDNGDGTYSTYPSAYLLDYNKDGSKRGFRFQYFDPSILNDETGFTYSHASVIRLEIPEGITIIHHDDRNNINLNSCDSMLEVSLPSTVTTFTKGDLLNGCTSLVKVDMSKMTGVKSLPGSTMPNNPCLTEVILPSTLTSLGNSTFQNCTALTSIELPEGLTSIGQNSFNSCNALASIDIPSTVTSIGQYAFRYCNSLTSVVIPESVTSLGSHAFRDCKLLASATLPSNIKSLPSDLFNTCPALTSIVIPESVTAIPGYMFNGCKALTTVTLHDGITSIGQNAFANCPIEDILVPSGLVSIGASAFIGARFSSFVMPNTVTSVGNACFRDNPNLSNLVISSSLTSISQDCFKKCTSLTTVVIPDSITVISPYAFDSCSALTTVTLSDNITSIGKCAFVNCPLTALDLPSSLESIGEQAFQATSITSLVIPSGVTTISKQCFNNCKSLSSLTLNDGLVTIDFEAFGNNPALLEVTIPNSVKTLGSYAFKGCSSLTTATIPTDSLIEGSWVNTFQGCSKLTSIFIPKGVVSLDGNVFNGCSSLKEIVFSEGLTEIKGSTNFNGCSSVTSVTLPNSLKSIAGANLNGFSSLQELRLGDSLETLGDGNLMIKTLKRVYIPASLSSIGAYILGRTNPNDSSSNITFVFTGTYSQAQALRDIVKADTSYTANGAKFYDAIMVSFDEYDITAEPSGCHLVYGYSRCEAFYNGAHNKTAINSCVELCSVCSHYYALASQTHNYEGGETIVYEDFTKNGYVGSLCQNEGCSHSQLTSETVDPIFVFAGYAIYEKNDSINMTVFVNREALLAYENATGIKLSYGTVVASKEYLGSQLPLDPTSATPVDLSSYGARVVKTELSDRDAYTLEIRLTGLGEHIDDELYACVYIYDGSQVVYISNTESSSSPKVTSYADVRGPIETTIGNITYSSVGETAPADDRIKQMNESNATFNTGSELSSTELQGSSWYDKGILGKANTVVSGGKLLGYNNAANFMSHFLKATSENYNLNVTSFINSDTGAKASRDTAINNALRAAEILAREGETLTINQLTEGHPMQGSLAEKDWQYSLGSYFDDVDIINLTVKEVNGIRTYTADIKYIVTDYYNWNKNDTNAFLGIGPSPYELYQLHLAGLAREFLTYGEVTYSSITWTEGQTVADLGI